MNAWWDAWPGAFHLNKNIDPLFISYHLSRPNETPESVYDYLRAHQPIGCRDTDTVAALEQHNVRAYFSACLTLTLGKSYHHTGSNKEILLVDLPRSTWHSHIKYILFNNKKDYFCENIFKHIFSKQNFLFQKRIPYLYNDTPFRALTQMAPAGQTPEQYFLAAHNLLTQYEKASLIVTSRLHTALPCLAMGTPVILLHPSTDNRFGGLLPLLNNITGRGNSYQENVQTTPEGRIINSKKWQPYATSLSQTIEKWLQK